ncbi:MAG: acetyl-CoA carboxylase biotin carboxyl carrier protein [Bryobacterales bacterium]|nr:acetyl-CoA carboxylase biotin carboxyl carrier protein [Bryobacterales bacterium]
MTKQEIEEILAIFQESGVLEMEVQRGENRLRLRRGPIEQERMVSSGPAPAPVPAPAVSTPAKPSAPDPDETLVKSPIVGTYYDAPKPEAPPFVKVGDRVEAGQVLCVIESMKLMNEIEAETAGIIAAKLVENGRPVEYGEALFAIRRLA